MPPVAKVVAGLANYCSYSSATTKFFAQAFFFGQGLCAWKMRIEASKVTSYDSNTRRFFVKQNWLSKLTTEEEASPWRVCTTVAPITIEKFG
jgi:hypothetical protein